jgi:hypothetical protein
MDIAPVPANRQVPPEGEVARVTVVWHPYLPRGMAVAEAVGECFEPARDDEPGGGATVGVRVATGGPDEADHPPPVHLGGADANVVLLLADGPMCRALAGPWRPFLDDLRAGLDQRSGQDVLLVAALDRAALQLPLPAVQALRCFEWHESPLAAPGADGVPAPGLVRLLIHAADALSHSLKRSSTGTSAPRERLFLSHAKADGAEIAARLRDHLYRNPYQLDSFFDAADLRPGDLYPAQFDTELANCTLLAIQTDAYASRPFCRYELLRAKRSRRPVFIVHQLREGEERVFPYGGNVPMRVLPPEPSDAAVDRLLLDVMSEVVRCLVFERRAARFVARAAPKRVSVLPRRPELADLAFAFIQHGSEPAPDLVVHPDPPLDDVEAELLAFLPGANRLRTLSEAETGASPTAVRLRPLDGRVVGISVSESPDLRRLGLMPRHLDLALGTLVAGLGARGARLLYGGDLRPGGFTQRLLRHAAEAYQSAAIGTAAPPIIHVMAPQVWDSEIEAGRLVEYLKMMGGEVELRLMTAVGDGWITVVADDLGYEFRPPPGQGSPERPIGAEAVAYLMTRLAPHRPAAGLDRAIALSTMRSVMAGWCDARVLLGGRVEGYSGAAPGIGEEALAALDARCNSLVLPLAAAGGCSYDVASALGLLDNGTRTMNRVSVGPGYIETMETLAARQSRCAELWRSRGVAATLVAAVASTSDPRRAASRAVQAVEEALGHDR